MENFKTKITKLHYTKNPEGILFDLLKFCSYFYGFGSRTKNFLYDKHILRPKKVHAYVISVGNMTTGGVGKTPVVSEIAKYYIKQGKKTAIISRGYGGKLSNSHVNIISDGKATFYDAQSAGDEPIWLAQNTPGCYVVTCKSRYKAAKHLVDKLGVEVIILDDGFQHRKLYRDLDIVLMDSVKGFGNENLLPAGPLREGAEALDRIDKLVIVSKSIKHDIAKKVARIMHKRLQLPTLVCYTEPDYVYNIKTGQRLMEGMDATAMCAIGQPQQFYDFLKDFNIVKTVTFDDHHQYLPTDILDISGNIITTEKDAVKLERFDRDNIYALKLKTTINVEELLK
ncbi:MAG TPA: tetraacyldisaccharide 4'-kinase [Cyanobacteria bacterium UBA11991]|nr:tetraacyldisaccharide 4'-kinase [Cyanobacteriota bacterium]MDY6358022.1 tetraacyldisaccharide 4'-kinase [Cyanobacteriota bacterium]MDY6363349.1 tetraacyldisaccharide 4'-kinase [Cyanobacteriota bacterium]MDY6382453.1 tetraacyldisaccharide 4'-kinase [Cyanobacteriota bacterium]HCB11868.1 tetraacyldisaccharide 4'-kinase [Cyanobacteria bacterium UBA11991]